MAVQPIMMDSDLDDIGQKLYDFAEKMYPVCRSITGQGVRDTLEMIRREVPIEIHQVPSGTRVYDW